MAQVDHVVGASAAEIVGDGADANHGRTLRKQPSLDIKQVALRLSDYPGKQCLYGVYEFFRSDYLDARRLTSGIPDAEIIAHTDNVNLPLAIGLLQANRIQFFTLKSQEQNPRSFAV